MAPDTEPASIGAQRTSRGEATPVFYCLCRAGWGRLDWRSKSIAMKRLLSIVLAAMFSHANAIAAPFEPFAALSSGKDCRITLDFPDGDFCGLKVAADRVRSWYLESSTNLNNNDQMIFGHKFDFTVVALTDKGIEQIPITFLNPGTAKRFYVQLGAWSGKPSADGGRSPFPNWLYLAK